MVRYMVSLFIASCCAAAMTAYAADAPEGIVWGDNVRMRSRADTGSDIVEVLSTGRVVAIIAAGDKRQKLGKDDQWGYFWYNVRSGTGKTGWVYGKYLYLHKESEFLKDVSLLKKELPIAGKKYLFAVPVEPAYPVMDGEGLTGSTIHGLPCLYEKGQATVIPFVVEKGVPELPFRETRGENYIFRLQSHEGVGEKITDVSVVKKPDGEQVQITVKWIGQEEEGSYRLLVKKKGASFVVTECGKEKNVLREF